MLQLSKKATKKITKKHQKNIKIESAGNIKRWDDQAAFIDVISYDLVRVLYALFRDELL